MLSYSLRNCLILTGNLRLQEMMGKMADERGAKLYATDDRLVFGKQEKLMQTQSHKIMLHKSLNTSCTKYGRSEYSVSADTVV